MYMAICIARRRGVVFREGVWEVSSEELLTNGFSFNTRLCLGIIANLTRVLIVVGH